MHYVVNCLMLTNCHACSQIIEVSSLNSHLVKECVKKHEFKTCKRCRESISVAEFEQHDKAQTCMPWKPLGQANRCPLCHKDIGAGEKGWRQHLMTKRCFANERNNPQPLPEIIEGEQNAGERAPVEE